MENNQIRIGVLALQGGFIEHVKMIRSLGVTCQELKTIEQIKAFDPHGLILPGGESTAMSIIAGDMQLFPFIKDMVHSRSLPVWGTCAGSIMLSNQVDGQKQGGNYFGRQINSFETTLSLNLDGEKVAFDGVFIRAPAILKVLSDDVEVLGEFVHTKKDNTKEKVVIAVRHKNMVATVFHPELTQDSKFHQYFVNIVKKSLLN
eukprot:gene3824-4414_t